MEGNLVTFACTMHTFQATYYFFADKTNEKPLAMQSMCKAALRYYLDFRWRQNNEITPYGLMVFYKNEDVCTKRL